MSDDADDLTAIWQAIEDLRDSIEAKATANHFAFLTTAAVLVAIAPINLRPVLLENFELARRKAESLPGSEVFRAELAREMAALFAVLPKDLGEPPGHRADPT